MLLRISDPQFQTNTVIQAPQKWPRADAVRHFGLNGQMALIQHPRPYFSWADRKGFGLSLAQHVAVKLEIARLISVPARFCRSTHPQRSQVGQIVIIIVLSLSRKHFPETRNHALQKQLCKGQTIPSPGTSGPAYQMTIAI